MSRTVWFLSFIVLSAAMPAFGADDAVARAMKLYEKRHYAEAAAALRSDMRQIDPVRHGAAQLTLGMIYLKNAELHRELYRQSLVVHLDYLKKLAAARGKSRSLFVDLYMGEALLEAGKFRPALDRLQKFASHRGIGAREKAIVRAAIGACYALLNDRQKAEESWAGLDTRDPEIKAALAAAYARSGYRNKDSAKLAEESLATVKKKRAPSMRHLKNILAVYAAEAMSDKGLAVIARADLSTSSYRESRGKSKVINFYDVSLLGDLSKLYLQAAIAALEKAAADVNLGETANFYLAEAHALAGNTDRSMKALGIFIASSSVPRQYRDKAKVRQAANEYRKGRAPAAVRTWSEFSKKQPQDPQLLADILGSCTPVADCGEFAGIAADLVDTGESRRLSVLNAALGRYYLSNKDYTRAAAHLEAGRDKGNKNKIESNDPLILVSLAEAYYRTKKFSEALEIYFEMSRQFPEVRQLQEALQGVYAMEHESAGDVKIN